MKVKHDVIDTDMNVSNDDMNQHIDPSGQSKSLSSRSLSPVEQLNMTDSVSHSHAHNAVPVPVVVQDQALSANADDGDGRGRRISSGSVSAASVSSSPSGAAQIIADDGDVDNRNGGNSSRPSPAEIPPEPDHLVKSEDNGLEDDREDHENDSDSNSGSESDYSYDYDDEDAGHYSGFIMTTEIEPAPATTSNSATPNESASASLVLVPQEEHNGDGTATATSTSASAGNAAKHVVEDEDAKETQVPQFATLQTSGHKLTNSNGNINRSNSNVAPLKSKYKEPTQQAKSMSHKAHSETSGGRRRLASDLFKVMMTDTKEAGFEVEQKDEESMDTWIVRLFKFDEDSDLHKDLLVLGLDCVELEMNFPEQVGTTLFKKF